MSIRHTLAPVVVVLLLMSGAASAQTLSVTGRVADPQGAAVANAVVTLNPSSTAVRTTQSTTDGTFSFAGVPVGLHVLQVDSPGFERSVRNISVSAGASAFEVALQVSGISETIAVAAPKLEEELPQQVERAGSRIQTITSEQIENGGYYDVGQALQALVPGLFLTPKAGPFDYVAASLQGSRTNEILWLVDGVRISNRLYNGTTPIDTLPAHMIERIEVIEGGQGLFYGTQAVAGAINVVTKSFTEAANGTLQAAFDTNEGRHLNAFTRAAAGGNRFVLYASTDNAKGFQSFPSTEFSTSTTDRNRSYDVLTVGAKYAYDFSAAARLSAMYQGSGVQLDNLRPTRSSRIQVGGLSAAYNERVENIASGKFDYTPRESAQLFVKGYLHRWDSHWSERRNVIGQPGATTVISDKEFWGYKDYGANVLARFAPSRGLEYFTGYDFQNYSGRDDVLLIEQNTETVHALFGQVRTTPEVLKKATLAAGVRYNAPTHSKQGAVWNVSGRYDITPNTYARGIVGTAFRYPDAYELFAKDPTCCFGNPNLKPETSTNLNVSLGRRILAGSSTALNIEAIGFFRRVTDLIVDVDDGSGETTVTANRPDVVRVRGLAIVGSGALGAAVSASLGYTYNRSQQSTNELAGGYSALAGIPSHQVEGSLDVHPASVPFGAMLTVNKVGEMFDTVSGFGSVPSGDYTVVDLAGRIFLDARRHHRINLRLENLFDEDYTTIHARGFPDSTTGAAFVVHNLGVPRTLHVSYGFSF
jgi:outer membrane cobalamin receptor